ncbi:MAG: two-component regulator propeller domain-containing protein [Prolixibacteraceae bacterium]|jgi:ligand-binding sensor domain-containing protein|nr:two-component regulator propeller domain-containing protein [Prolixibacteraceae bacterium]
MTKKLILIFLMGSFLKAGAQAPVGEWTNYQSYRSASKLADAGELVYCAGNGGLFVFNKSDNSPKPLSSINGLSDVGIEALAYGEQSNVVLIAYKNSNIDLIFGNDIYNLSDIKRKQIMGNKAINKVMFDGSTAYLSCGFGIVVINTEKREVKDTWYIAEGGAHLTVYDMASDGDSLYAATSAGIYRALSSEPNLQDYSNWQRFSNLYPTGRFTQIENLNGKIIACYSPASGNDELYMLDNGNWTRVFTEVSKVYDMTVAFNDRIIISNNGDVYVFAENGEIIEKIFQYDFGDTQSRGIDPRCTLLNSDGTYWIADNQYGLVYKKPAEYWDKGSPNGPFDNMTFSLTISEGNLWVASGGRDAAWGNLWNPARFQKKDDEGNWSVFDQERYPEMARFRDMVYIASDPGDPGHVFAASWGGGIFEFSGNELVKQHSFGNSSLEPAIPGNDEYVRVGGLAFDKNGTLWVSNGGGGNVLSSYKNETWQSYSIPDLANKYNLGNLIVTNEGDKWIIVPRSNDLYLVKGENEARQWQRNIAYFSNGTEEIYLPMHDVYSIAVDRDGAVWVGSAGGVAVYDKPSRIWNDPQQDPLARYARQPGLEMGDGIYHPLLASETVTAIAVDGGNRKWCGTKANGVFLISENGEKELEHFTVDNSPLLSNEITSIAIDSQRGEVFFGTSEGLISYMGVATEPEKKFTDVYVYPNPVRETYDGPIVVSGLMEDTDVKITDISGNLVFHGTSFGGQISWDGKNRNGNRCHTGVYLVFLNNKSGEETLVTKILFIH